MDLNKVSRFLSLILRHHPEKIGITLDEHGWASVEDLLNGISKTYSVDREMLEEIVRTDDKQRYSFNDDKTLIRANQGHSIDVDVELFKNEPPKILYHGTGKKYVSSIDKNGLISKSRLFVHLSADEDTAITVGSRHGTPVVYKVMANEMYLNGYDFYQSINGIWLTKKFQYNIWKNFNIPTDRAGCLSM